MLSLSRRGFLLTPAFLYAQGQLTARAVVERIQKNVGVSWRENTVDVFKAGDPETPVKGIATSFAGTFDVLKRASAAGKNLVIVHEPTFYNHLDETKDLAGEVFKEKQDFIAANKVVVWRFHDHWHARRPDGILTGMVESLGWDKYHSGERANYFILPAATLNDLARSVRDRMGIKTIRVIGDPQIKVSRVVLNPGFNNLPGVMRALERPEVDVLVIGESREWEGIEFARDVASSGRRKGLIVMGHVPSEENGMKECARWLKTFISEVPIEFVPSGEPFWQPK